jgi:hypothetical protein
VYRSAATAGRLAEQTFLCSRSHANALSVTSKGARPCVGGISSRGFWVLPWSVVTGFVACDDGGFDDCRTSVTCLGSGAEGGGANASGGDSAGHAGEPPGMAGTEQAGQGGGTPPVGGALAGESTPPVGGAYAGKGGSSSIGATTNCDWAEPFDTVIAMPSPFNGLFSSESFWLSSDGNIAYFGYRIDKQSFDILTSTRSANSALFVSPNRMFDAATSLRQVSLSDDQRMLAAQDQADVFLTVRESTRHAFNAWKKLPAPVNLEGYDGEPFLTRDGTALYFVSNRMGSMDLFFVPLESGQPSPEAIPLGINTGDYEGGPAPSADGLDLYFHKGPSTSAEMWVAHREQPDGPFLQQRRLDEINTTTGEFPEMISDDGCTLYFLTLVQGGYRIDQASKKRG